MRKFLREKDIDPGVKRSIERFVKYLTLIIGILITLDTIGISMQSLAALGAILMVGIGFGLQNITSNFISGLIILFERPIKVGDIVKVGDVSGKVEDIGARATIVHTRDDVAIIVPNSKFVADEVVNESFSGQRIRLNIQVGVAYGTDASVVREELLDIAKKHKQVLSHPGPTVLFQDFADSALIFELRIWVDELWTYDLILSDIRYAINEQFKQKQIQIPFPQLDIHTK